MGQGGARQRTGASLDHRQLPAHAPLLRADIELGRGDFDAPLEAARPTVRHEPGVATYDGCVAELALWERRWTDAEEAVHDGMAWARPDGERRSASALRQGLRAHAELAALARARRDADAVRTARPGREAHRRRAPAAAAEAAAITPNAAGTALTEAEYRCPRRHAAQALVRRRGHLGAAGAAAAGGRCRWRQAEALPPAPSRA